MSNKKFIIIVSLLLAVLAFLAFLIFRPEITETLQSPSAKKSEKKCVDGICPAQIINLKNWKLTLPTSAEKDSSSPREVTQPQLSDFEIAPWFAQTADKKGVFFRAPVSAPTTSGSSYPRSELREMTADGKKNLFWPSTEGKHSLFIDQAITAVPENKPDVVSAQIHGDDDDLIVIRLEYPRLFVARGKSELAMLDEQYELGRRFTISLVAENGQIKVYYNGSADPVYELDKKVRMAYFKAGVYTQSNCETEKNPELCTDNNYGEVAIYQIDVKHE